MELNKIASAIINDLWGGNLIPISERSLISVEQIEDEVMAERALVIKEWILKNAFSPKDMAYTISCIPVDCEDPSKCPCTDPDPYAEKIPHFEIPALLEGIGRDAIIYIGSTDRAYAYNVFFDREAANMQKYKRRNKRPYVYIEKTPNANGMYDGWIFGAPLVKEITLIGVFKDPRQLDEFMCCQGGDFLNFGEAVSSEIIRRILAKKANLYRTAVPPAAKSV